MRKPETVCAWSGLVVVALALGGCLTQEEWNRLWEKDKGAQPEPTPRLISKTQATAGTVGELVTVDGLRLQQVRGFGLVVDLVDTGGSDGPDMVRKHILKEIRRRQQPGDPDVLSSDLLKGRDTALVEVRGLIPAAAEKGRPFDVVVRALGTQTTSLAGGRLFLCDLKPFAETVDAVLGGKTIATASGPIFISPIGLEKEIPEQIDLRTGLVLGGGAVTQPRNIRLVLNEPSPSVATRIVDRLNSQFSKSEPIASGRSFSTIDLTIPPEYRGRTRLFIEHVLHTSLNANPAALEQRARDLAQEATHPDAEFESIGAAWEAIGRTVLPTVKKLYQHSLPAASFYAARTGLRLGDNEGMEIVARHALDPASPFRLQAIEELGDATRMHGAGECLRKLLDDEDSSIRLRAYKALRKRPHPAIKTSVLFDDNLVLDIVDSRGPYLVYVQRSLAPRVALFGGNMTARPPAIYPGERRDNRLLLTQINAAEEATEFTVIRRNKHTGKISPKLSAPFNVPDFVRFLGDSPTKSDDGDLTGLAIPYDEIVDILHTFCEAGTIPAEFHAEDLTGQETSIEVSRERKESEY